MLPVRSSPRILRFQGELARASEFIEQALASDIRSLGEDHPSVATRRSNLATVLQDQGDLARACALFELDLASNIKNLGEGHPSVGICRGNLATVLQDQGELASARELLELALASNIKNLGEDHPPSPDGATTWRVSASKRAICRVLLDCSRKRCIHCWSAWAQGTLRLP